MPKVSDLLTLQVWKIWELKEQLIRNGAITFAGHSSCTAFHHKIDDFHDFSLSQNAQKVGNRWMSNTQLHYIPHQEKETLQTQVL